MIDFIKILPQGQQNAVPAAELAEILNFKDIRTMQMAIGEARREGQLICSSVKGYFLPADDSEIEQYIATLKSRALSTLKTIKTANEYLKKDGSQLCFDLEGFTNEQTE